MTTSKLSTGVLPSGHASNDGRLQVTPGERFKIRTSVEDTAGAYTMLEVVADSRNGVPMHIHENEDEHFVVLEGVLHVANGDKRLDAPAGAAVGLGKGVPHAWCNLSDAPVRMLVVLRRGMSRDCSGKPPPEAAVTPVTRTQVLAERHPTDERVTAA